MREGGQEVRSPDEAMPIPEGMFRETHYPGLTVEVSLSEPDNPGVLTRGPVPSILYEAQAERLHTVLDRVNTAAAFPGFLREIELRIDNPG
jgi:uncharacterized protein YwbE